MEPSDAAAIEQVLAGELARVEAQSPA